MSEENVELCTRVSRELFGGGKLELADDLMSDDFVDHEAFDPSVTGPAAAKATVGWLHSALDDMEYEICDAFGAGDRVAVRTVMHATQAREFMGRPATGRRFAMKQVHIFRVADGKVAEHWACRDDVGMMRQLGFI